MAIPSTYQLSFVPRPQRRTWCLLYTHGIHLFKENADTWWSDAALQLAWSTRTTSSALDSDPPWDWEGGRGNL